MIFPVLLAETRANHLEALIKQADKKVNDLTASIVNCTADVKVILPYSFFVGSHWPHRLIPWIDLFKEVWIGAKFFWKIVDIWGEKEAVTVNVKIICRISGNKMQVTSKKENASLSFSLSSYAGIWRLAFTFIQIKREFEVIFAAQHLLKRP